MIVQTALVVLSICAAACRSPTAPRAAGRGNSGQRSPFATLLWRVGSGPCAATIGVTYDPMNGIAPAYQRENLRVTLVTKVRDDLGGVHMVGPIVEVLSIQAR